jgi:hypothetical protein
VKATLSLVLALLCTLGLAQAPDFGGKEQAEKMKALSFLAGRWEGEATVNAGGRQIPLKGFENVDFMAGGTCVLVNANWTMKAGDREIPIHQPCAMIWWDSTKKTYRMLAQLSNGLRNEFDVQVKDKGFVWTLNNPQAGEVRYTMNLLEDGTWHELGEHKTAEGKWETTMEMKLKKVK